MTFAPIVTPWLLGGLLLVPLGIAALYFLKLRRQPVAVPSTLLWTAANEDSHVNSLLQRLRRSVLLALQLAVAGLVLFALLRPSIDGVSTTTQRRIFLIDTSASMNASDVAKLDGGQIDFEGTSRLDIARQRIAAEIDAMRDSETAMLIAFNDMAETLQPFTSDRRRLRTALSRVKPSRRVTDITGALRAADGLANPRRTSQIGDANDVQVADALPADLIVHSDGGFDRVDNFSLGNLIPRFVPVGVESPSNLAITQFSAARNVESIDQIEVFGSISNLCGPRRTVVATLRGGVGASATFLDATELTIDPDQTAAVSFALQSDEAMELSLSLSHQPLDNESGGQRTGDAAGDDLAEDDIAYAALSPSRVVRVLIVTPGNKPLQIGLDTPSLSGVCRTEIVDPSFLSTDDFARRSRRGDDDLIIFDRCGPTLEGQSTGVAMPRCNTMWIGSLPPAGWRFTSSSKPVNIIDFDRTDPLLQYVELLSLLIVQGRGIAGPEGTVDLVTSDIGTVMAAAPRDGLTDLVLGFDLISSGADGGSLINTNWYAERSWPVFLLNVLRVLGGAGDATAAASYRPGSTVSLRIPAGTPQITITRRGGEASWTLPVPATGLVEFVHTDQTGLYVVQTEQNDDDVLQTFCVNLLDRVESRLSVADALDIGYQPIPAETIATEGQREYWPLAISVALGLLVTEWLIYGRRI